MKIHLHSKSGLYEVVTYGRNSITLSTKHNIFSVPTDDFKAFAGGIWNNTIHPQDFAIFLATVKPEEYKLQVQQEDQILTLAARVDRIKAEVAQLSIQELMAQETEYKMSPEEKHYQSLQDQQEEEYEKYMKDLEHEKTNRAVFEWESMLKQKDTELEKADKKLKNIASNLYSQPLDYSNLQMHTGIKFIIQQDWHNDKLNRFCWDPYGFVNNYHSSISDIYHEGDWSTRSGGWIKIIDNNVILYAKSGDYGVYDDTVAIECAKKIFPGKVIHSFAGRDWDNEMTNMFDDLPF
jgi:hypothetical protein